MNNYIKINYKLLSIMVVLGLILYASAPSFLPYNLFVSFLRISELFVLLALVYVVRNSVIKHGLVVLLLMLVYCRNNYYIELGNVYAQVFLVCVLLLLLADEGINHIVIFIKGTCLLYSVSAVCTILFRFTPGLYIGRIATLYPSTYKRLVEWYAQGCMAGLSSHYTINAIFISFGLIISFSQAMKKNSFFKLYIVEIIIFVVALLLTGKRGHILFSAASIFFISYMYFSNDKKIRKMYIFRSLVITIIAIIIIMIFFPGLGTFITRFSDSIDSGDITNNRTLFWLLAINLFFENPFWGIGWGHFIQISDAVLGYSAHVHNNFLQLLCETGIIGTVIYVVWMIVILCLSAKIFLYIRHNNIDRNELGNITWAFCVQCFFFFYCFTGNPLYDKEVFIPFFMSCIMTLYYKSQYNIYLIKLRK